MLEGLVGKRILIIYSASALIFGLVLALVPQPLFTLLGCDANCIAQITLWTIGFIPTGFGLIYMSMKPSLNLAYEKSILGIYVGVFLIMVVSLAFWGYDVFISGLDLGYG